MGLHQGAEWAGSPVLKPLLPQPLPLVAIKPNL